MVWVCQAVWVNDSARTYRQGVLCKVADDAALPPRSSLLSEGSQCLFGLSPVNSYFTGCTRGTRSTVSVKATSIDDSALANRASPPDALRLAARCIQWINCAATSVEHSDCIGHAV